MSRSNRELEVELDDVKSMIKVLVQLNKLVANGWTGEALELIDKKLRALEFRAHGLTQQINNGWADGYY